MVLQDQIEREIVIDAPLQRVWGLVSAAGWWIGDGDQSAQRRWKEGELDIIEDPKYGRFPVRTVAREEPNYISFRWEPESDGEGVRNATTLVEFWLRVDGDRTVVRVVESGFASLPNPEQSLKDNTEGWIFELDLLRSNAEQA